MLPEFAVAVWLAWRRPDHAQARRLLLTGTASAAGVVLDGLVRDGYLAGASWLWAAVLASQYAAVVRVVAVAGLLALYPDGVGKRPWHAGVARGLWGLLALPLLLLVTNPHLVIHPIQLNRPPEVPSPVVVSWLAPLGPPLARAPACAPSCR